MSGAFARVALLIVFGLGLAGCAGTQNVDLAPQSDNTSGQSVPQSFGAVATPRHKLQCVPYARARSGIPLHGDAYTWWNQAAGKFERGPAPKEGAVMVLTGYAGPNHGHVAVVRKVVGAREIKVDHANWLDDGAIYLDDPVVDVSPANDWSVVRVWNIRSNSWGDRIYPVRGFIGPGPEGDGPTLAERPVISLN